MSTPDPRDDDLGRLAALHSLRQSGGYKGTTLVLSLLVLTIVIGMAAAGLPPVLRRRAIIIGIGAGVWAGVRRGRFIVVPSGTLSRVPRSGVCVRG